MLVLALAQIDPEYLEERGTQPLPLVLSCVDVAEPPSRYFESAAASWLGAPLFPG